MIEVNLDGLAKHIEEGTIQTWFFEEGDAVNEGDELLEISTEEGVFAVQSPGAGILAEVYYDEGEVVAKGETLCTIDNDAADDDDEEDEEDDDDDEDEDDEDEGDEDGDDEDFDDDKE